MRDQGHSYLCWLNQIRGIGRKGRMALLRAAEGPNLFMETSGARELYCAPEKQLRFLCREAFSSEAAAGKAAELLIRARKKEPERVVEELCRAGIGFLCILEEGFPQRLRNIPDPPFAIYWMGRMPFSQDDGEGPAAAIIGARSASPYGRSQARRFAGRLGARGIAVISGMARGIDGIAQRAAMEAGGSSFGVLGCGVDICYPEENRDLYERLLEQGGVLSEYPPGVPPQAKLFPQRNRIISGLSDLVLVIEARKRSGTLITVDMALEQGREVYALPGRVSDHLSEGCNRLIRQGAGAATCPEDILEFFFGTGEGKADVRRKESVGLPEAAAGLSDNMPEAKAAVELSGTIPRAENTEELMKEPLRSLCVSEEEKPPASLEEAVLRSLSFDEDRHLERIYEKVEESFPSGREERGDIAGSFSLPEVNLCLLRMKLDGRVEETEPGYYHKVMGC